MWTDPVHCHSIPSPGKVGPVCHEVPAHVDFGLRVVERDIERTAEDKLYLVAVHGAHPGRPGVLGGSMGEKVEVRPSASHEVPEGGKPNKTTRKDNTIKGYLIV